MDSKKIIGYDIFCGAGGMSIGAQMAGIEIRLAIDSDKHAVETYKNNHENVEIYNSDIKNIDPNNFKTNEPLILFGGPPCQGFSVSNSKTRTIENKNNHLFKNFIEYVDILKPDWFVFENVEGILSFSSGEVVEQLEKTFNNIGYRTEKKVLLASDYGVPQNRNRFFLVGNKHGIKFEFPKPEFKVKVTVWDAIYDLPNLKNGDMFDELPYKKDDLNEYTTLMRKKSKKAKQNYVTKNKGYVLERYSHIKPGQNWKSIPDVLMSNYKNKNNCHSGIYRRLEKDKPSVVIANYRKNMLIHPVENRGLSLREAARLQSFPDDFIFHGSMGSKQQQIGNAVPPLLAKSIFSKIKTYI